jgi:hypothetical protein
MKKLTTLLLLLITFNAFSQDWPLKKLVLAKKASRVAFKTIPAFSFVNNKTMAKVGTYQQLSLNPAFSKQILEQKPEAIQVSIPLSSTTSVTCDLVKFSLGNIVVTTHSRDVIENVKVPVTYHGIITSDTGRNNVILTVNDEYLSLVATNSDRVLQVTKADETATAAYRLYNSSLMNTPPPTIDCGTNATSLSNKAAGIDLTGATSPLGSIDKCVYVFVDCSDSMYIWRDTSTQKTINYVYELFNYVATGYLNEQINIQLTGINIWSPGDTTYRRDTRANALTDLAARWKDNFWGNMCVGLDFGRGLGGRASVGAAKGVSANTCPSYKYSGGDSSSACCFCDLNMSGGFVGFPHGPNTTQDQVELVMHEMGHMLGSMHTQWCGWVISTGFPIVLGALDNCVATEGGCPPGAALPNGMGTIMSYCHLNGLISFNNGFGVQPGAAIRNYVDKNSCFPGCLVCTAQLNKPTDPNMPALAGPPGNVSTQKNTALLLTSTDGVRPSIQSHHLITNIKR